MSDLSHAMNRRPQELIQHLSRGQADRVCLFGSGDYGIRLYRELRSKGIDVHFFSDNNPDKWGYLLENLYCIPPERLKEEKERVLVIVSTRDPKAIVEQLQSEGYPYIATRQEVEQLLSDVPTVQWMTALEDIEGLDYSSKDVQLLIQRFNQIIYDIYRYYEDRSNSD